MDPTLDKVIQTPRFVARRRAVRAQERRRRHRIVAGLLAIVLLGGGAIALSRSLLFQLDAIAVVGTRTVSREDVVRASGLRLGQNALGLDLVAAAAAVEALPAVESARVQRDGSLGIRIIVIERTPAVQVAANGRRWYLDGDGRPVPGRPRGRVPVIVASSAPGVGVMLPRGSVDAVLSVWSAMPAGIRRWVRSFDAPADGTISFRLGEASVLFGTPTRIDQKIDALVMVRKRVAADGSTLLAVDVTAPDRPAARIS